MLHCSLIRSRPTVRPRVRRTRSAGDWRSGTAAVEFALIAPLFGLLIVGMLDTGRGMMVRHVLSEAAVKACRSGVLPGTDTAEMVRAAHRVLQANGVSTDGVRTTVLVNDQAVDASTAVRSDRITVIVSVPASQVQWSASLFLRDRTLSSEPVVMMRQG